MLLVAEPVNLLELLDHLATIDTSLSIRDGFLALFLVELLQYLSLMHLPRNEVDHVELAARVIVELRVFDFRLLRTNLTNMLLSSLHLWRCALLALGLRVVDLWLFLRSIHREKHVADFISTAELFPDVFVDVLINLFFFLLI